MKQKKGFFWKKIKMADSKNWVFQPPPKAEQFSPKFYGLVLGLVGLIDAKGRWIPEKSTELKNYVIKKATAPTSS